MAPVSKIGASLGGGEASYTSDLVVARDSGFECLGQLEGKTFAYNDEMSLSGYQCMRLWLHANAERRELPLPFFKRAIRTGAHAASLALVARGLADCAVIDRCVMSVLAREQPALVAGVRILGDVDVGPQPAQPVVVTERVSADQRVAITAAFLALPASLLGQSHHAYYRKVDRGVYDELARRLEAVADLKLLC